MNKPGYQVRLFCILTVISLVSCVDPAFAAQPFIGKLNSDNINVRSDSTAASAVITTLNKPEPVEVAGELYEWYKIKLPPQSPAFIKKNLVLLLDEKSGRVLKNSCNIRLRPDEKAPILGKADKDEVLGIIQESGDWYKVIPPANSFGWVHKRFVDKTDFPQVKASTSAVKKENPPASINADGNVVIEGVVESYGKVFKRKGTHKLVTVDDKIYFLKGNPKNLDSVTGYRVRISGTITNDKAQKYPVIEIIKLEILN